MARGRLIVIEGLDRAGKTTQCSKLAQELRKFGHEVVEMKFPDRTTEIGQMINAYLTNRQNALSDEAIHLLFSANRWEAMSKIEKLLDEGKILIVDRYVYSGIAFSAAKGLDIEWCKYPDRGLPKPDLVVFLDVDEFTAAKRGGYGDERYETEEIQKKVRTQFQNLREPTWSWILADSSIDELFAKIYNAVENALKNESSGGYITF